MIWYVGMKGTSEWIAGYIQYYRFISIWCKDTMCEIHSLNYGRVTNPRFTIAKPVKGS